MTKRKTHHEDVNRLVMNMVLARAKPGAAITPEIMAVAYEIVWAQLALDTIEWKQNNISEKVRHDR